MNEEQELPSGWALAPLADLCHVERGVTFPASAKSNQASAEMIACLRTANVQSLVDWDDLIYIPRTFVKSQEKLVRPYDILISMANSRELVGKVSFVDYLPVESTLGGFIAAIRVALEVAPKYLFYYLRLDATQEQFRKGSSQTVNIANISLDGIYSVPAPIPPLAEQQRIVAVIEQQFTRLDAGVAALKSAQTRLKRYRAAVLKAAVEGKLTKAWRAEHPETEPASVLLQRILAERRARWEADLRAKGKDPAKVSYEEPAAPDTTDLPELPEGWGWAGLGHVALFQNGRSFPSSEYRDHGVKLLRPGNLFADGTVQWTQTNTRSMPEIWAERNPDLIVGGHELIMNLTAQSLKDEFLGRICMTSGDEYCLLNQRLARITPLPGLDSSYTLYMLKSEVFRQFVNGLNKGSLIQHMFTSQLDDFCFPLPPLAEQEQIVAEVERRLSVVSELETTFEANLKRAERLRQSILHQAFAGRLVPQDLNDEPASVLLERIRQARQQQVESNGRKKNGKERANALLEVKEQPSLVQAEQISLWEK